MMCLCIRYLVTFDIVALRNLLRVFLVRFSAVPSYQPRIFFRNIDRNERIEFARVEKPVVSIIIPVYNQWEYTISCLHSIRAHSAGVAYEVIVADDGSTDETRHVLDRVGNVKLVCNRQNLQFLKNCNSAARHATGKYLVFLNNDTNVQENWLSRLLEVAETDPAVGMVGAKLVYPDGRLQEAGGIVWQDGSGWNYGWFDDPDKPQYNYLRQADYVSGACFLIRRELWEKTGGFDERFAPAYYEDTDLAFQVRSLGYKVMYQPGSVVVHFEGVSSGTDPGQGTKRYQRINRLKFLEKWRPVLNKEHVGRGRRLPTPETTKP